MSAVAVGDRHQRHHSGPVLTWAGLRYHGAQRIKHRMSAVASGDKYHKGLCSLGQGCGPASIMASLLIIQAINNMQVTIGPLATFASCFMIPSKLFKSTWSTHYCHPGSGNGMILVLLSGYSILHGNDKNFPCSIECTYISWQMHKQRLTCLMLPLVPSTPIRSS